MSVTLYGQALLATASEVVVRTDDGLVRPLPAARWTAPCDAVDLRIANRLDGPTLDIGCGPGRFVCAIAARGVPVLGIDVTPTATAMTRLRGGSALTADVFGRVPGAGRWRWALLLDGNIGIGGQPRRLLQRTAELLALSGAVIVEVEPAGTGSRTQQVRLESGQQAGPWFPWAWLSVDRLDDIAAASGLVVRESWQDEGRCFARLTRRQSPPARTGRTTR